jgi:hypothetical protein
MAVRFEFESNGQAISKPQQINPILTGVDTTADVVCWPVKGFSGYTNQGKIRMRCYGGRNVPSSVSRGVNAANADYR